jgi:hypothetical protein
MGMSIGARMTSGPYRPQSAALRVERNEVQVGVVVRDSKGHVVSGLTQRDFAVYWVPAAASFITATTSPLATILLPPLKLNICWALFREKRNSTGNFIS